MYHVISELGHALGKARWRCSGATDRGGLRLSFPSEGRGPSAPCAGVGVAGRTGLVGLEVVHWDPFLGVGGGSVVSVCWASKGVVRYHRWRIGGAWLGGQ